MVMAQAIQKEPGKSEVAVSPAEAKSGGTQDWNQWRGPNGNGFVDDKNWDPANPKILWKAKVGYTCGSISVVGNRVYVPGALDINKAKLFCLEADTGKEIW